jgi:hypothetical protein
MRNISGRRRGRHPKPKLRSGRTVYARHILGRSNRRRFAPPR